MQALHWAWTFGVVSKASRHRSGHPPHISRRTLSHLPDHVSRSSFEFLLLKTTKGPQRPSMLAPNAPCQAEPQALESGQQGVAGRVRPRKPLMKGRRRKGRVSKSLSKVGKEATGTVVSALGLVPVVGTAIGILDTTRRAVRTARATKRAGKALKAKVSPRRRRSRRR